MKYDELVHQIERSFQAPLRLSDPSEHPAAAARRITDLYAKELCGLETLLIDEGLINILTSHVFRNDQICFQFKVEVDQMHGIGPGVRDRVGEAYRLLDEVGLHEGEEEDLGAFIDQARIGLDRFLLILIGFQPVLAAVFQSSMLESGFDEQTLHANPKIQHFESLKLRIHEYCFELARVQTELSCGPLDLNLSLTILAGHMYPIRASRAKLRQFTKPWF